MVLGEAYLKGILRPPLADAKALPPNPPHPFQTNTGFYLKQRFLKHHFPLVVGFAVAIWAFTGADNAMRAGKKKAYDEAVAAGRSPCESAARAAPQPTAREEGWSGRAGAAGVAGLAPRRPRARATTHRCGGRGAAPLQRRRLDPGLLAQDAQRAAALPLQPAAGRLASA
jgi:hypothetical protein